MTSASGALSDLVRGLHVFGMSTMMAFVVLACGGSTTGSGSKGSGGSTSSSGASGGSGGVPECTKGSDCAYPLICIQCPDGTASCPTGASCVNGRCVTTYSHECGGSTGSGGSPGAGGAQTGGSPGTGGEMADAQVSCSPQSKCPNDMVCGYPIAQGCSALGACLVRPTPLPCNAIVELAACGCDGKTINWTGGCSPSLPTGFAPAPVVHNGACP